MSGIRLAAASLALLAVLPTGPTAAQDSAPALHLDHVPIAVRDLDVAVSTYRDRLGFAIKPGSPHANSILNAHIKFGDGSALELITATEPRDAQAARYLTALAEREGPVALALDGGPVQGLAAHLAGSDIGFSTAEHSYYESLSFETGSPLAHIFFLVVHRRPPDLPEHLEHANGALRLHAVWIASPDHAAERVLLERLGKGTGGCSDVALPVGRAEPVSLERGALYLVESGRPEARPIIGATVEVRELERAMEALHPDLRVAAVPGEDARGRYLRLPPEVTHGLWLELLEPG